LIEVLLVIAIIGILAGVVMLVGSIDIGRQQTVANEATRLALAVELARTEALQRNEVWGLAVNESAYRFRSYDASTGTWSDVDRKPFSPRTAETGVGFTVNTTFKRESHASTSASGPPPEQDDAPPPEIVIYPAGDVTPFEVVVTGGENLAAWAARCDGIQRTRASPRDEAVDEELIDENDWEELLEPAA